MTTTQVRFHGWWPQVLCAVVGLSAAGAGAWVVRAVWGDRLLVPALATGLAVVLLTSVATVGLVLVGIRQLRRLGTSDGPQMHEVRAGEDCLSLAWSAPWFWRLLAWKWEGWTTVDSAAGVHVFWHPLDRGKLEEHIRFTRRGVWTNPTRMLRLGDALGLWSLRLQVEVPEVWHVLPARCRPSPIRWPRAAFAGDDPGSAGRPEGDRIDFRAYQNGDSARYLAWKLIARRGECAPLLVRSQEIVGSKMVGFYFLPGTGDEAAAELMVHLLETEPLGACWTFGLRGVNRVFSGRGELTQARRAIVASAGASELNDGEVPGSLDTFAQRMRQRGAGIVVVVTSSQPAVPYVPRRGQHTLIAVRPDQDCAGSATSSDRQIVVVNTLVDGGGK